MPTIQSSVWPTSTQESAIQVTIPTIIFGANDAWSHYWSEPFVLVCILISMLVLTAVPLAAIVIGEFRPALSAILAHFLTGFFKFSDF